MDKTIELEGKAFEEIKNAMQAVVWESEREKGQRFYIEFDGENLKLYDGSGYNYFKEQVFDTVEFMSYYHDVLDEEEYENLSLPVPDPFKARINVKCFREMLKVIRDEYEGDEGVLKVRIFVDNNKAYYVYYQILNRKMCGYGGMNIVAECRFKISKSK
jgi:hypothetical protein